MDLLEKVNNTVLRKGDIVKSAGPGGHEWVVIDNTGKKIVLGCISKTLTKETDDLKEWYKVRA